jgi:hypothetical protein
MWQALRVGSGALRNDGGCKAALLCALLGVACGASADGDDCAGENCPTAPGRQCSIGGVTYASGSSGIPAEDSCNTCSCSDGELECTLLGCPDRSCRYANLTLPDGASQLASDGCNLCSCNAGEISCTERACTTVPASCSYAGETLASGESRPSADGCNTCSCSNGEMLCTERGWVTICYSDADCGEGNNCVFTSLTFLEPGSAEDRAAPPGGGGVPPSQTGECRPRAQACTLDFSPVCGCDGATYSNECAAVNSGVPIASRSFCR